MIVVGSRHVRGEQSRAPKSRSVLYFDGTSLGRDSVTCVVTLDESCLKNTMTVFVPDAVMIPSQDVEVCCANCGEIYCLPTLSDNEKQRLFQCTQHMHAKEEMQAVECIERLLVTFPNTRNQLIRSKVDEKCFELDWALLRLNAARNTDIHHEAYWAHVRRLEERVDSIRLEISNMDSLRENASEADEDEISRLLGENPRIFKWLHGVFKLQGVKERLNERTATFSTCDDCLPCRECENGLLYISRQCYDSIYHGTPR